MFYAEKVRSGCSIASTHCIHSVQWSFFLPHSFLDCSIFYSLGGLSIAILFSVSVLFTWFSSTFLFSILLLVSSTIFFLKMVPDNECHRSLYFLQLEQFTKWSFIIPMNLNSKFDQVHCSFSLRTMKMTGVCTCTLYIHASVRFCTPISFHFNRIKNHALENMLVNAY